ncbi:DUF1489 domain-containing protein [Amylibacter sp. IMCC11727]|uniref:DUF1489 family protein n=1 Tax=Amylibacter sp. IMCC11727 TaxID=3039851 RepID=UPI00244E23CB|nr:DUF1489 domain-containing protein [Amylibacter sp. IMCC11727]WGI21356.1 DUF1489 domain-containing protein [Amylibacter sp. IMCC11727]
MSKSTYMNLIKLCVGADSFEDQARWIAQRKAAGGPNYLSSHVTRMWPKQEAEILKGGSLYWVIKGAIQARQKIVRLDEVIGQDGIRRCAIVMEPELIRTNTAIRRPFQGWRYLKPEDAPADLPKSRVKDDALPKDLALALADIGLR